MADLSRNSRLLVEHVPVIPQGKSYALFTPYKWCNIKTQSYVIGTESPNAL